MLLWYLRLLHWSSVFVTHGANLHAFVSLPVTLGEILHHDTVCPLPVDLQRLCRVAEVSTVHHILENLKPEDGRRVSFYDLSQWKEAVEAKSTKPDLYSVRVVVQQQYSQTGHFLCLNHGF